MEILGRIRRMRLRDGLGFSEISRRTGLSRNTVKRWLKDAAPGEVAVPKYRRPEVPGKLAPYMGQIERWLVADGGRIKRDRRTGKQIFESIKALGYSGGYSRLTDTIRQ
jgi:transcriptional regulator with XRE-family HTH domain